MSIYFDKNKRLIIDKPYQAKEICVYCYINDDIKVDCKFVDFNKFYCKRCNNSWKVGKNQESKSKSKKQQDDEDSLFSLALRKTEVKPTEDASKNQVEVPIKKEYISRIRSKKMPNLWSMGTYSSSRLSSFLRHKIYKKS